MTEPRRGRTADTAGVIRLGDIFPEDYQGAGPMFAAVPLGDPWYNIAVRGVTTWIPESAQEGGGRVEAAFLDRHQAEQIADARTNGEMSRNEGLCGWYDITAARAEAERQGEEAAWGGRGPSASYAEWLAEGRDAGVTNRDIEPGPGGWYDVPEAGS